MKTEVVRTWLVYLFTLLTVAALNMDGVASWYLGRGEGREDIRTGLAALKAIHSESGVGPWLTSLECAAAPVFQGSYKDKSRCREVAAERFSLASGNAPAPVSSASSSPRHSVAAAESVVSGEISFEPTERLGARAPFTAMREADGGTRDHLMMEALITGTTARSSKHAPGNPPSVESCDDDEQFRLANRASGCSDSAADLTNQERQTTASLQTRFSGEHADQGAFEIPPPHGSTMSGTESLTSTTAMPPESQLESTGVDPADPPPIETISDKSLCGDAFGRNDFQSVLLVGDSLAHGLALSLGRELKDRKGTVFSFVAKVASGLNNPNVFNWERTVRMLIEHGAPDLLLVMMGVNDANNHIREGSRLCAVGTPEWGQAYENKVESFLRIASENNVHVCWIGIPVVREEGLQNRVLLANMAARNACNRVGNCRFIDTFEALCDENKKYTNYLKEPSGASVRIRAKDGIHFSMEGSNLLSNFILQKLETGVTEPSVQN